MGKNKWYNEMEGGSNPTFRPSGGTSGSKEKKSSPLPTLFFKNSQEESTFSAAFQSSFKRFRRKWLSLKFRGSQVSGTAFNKRALVKFAFLAMATYFIFGETVEKGAFISGGSATWKEETTLSVGSEKKRPTVPKAKKQPKSDTAPVASSSLRSDQSLAYIKKYSGIARQEMKKFGIPASISLAQGLVESRAGTSKLAVGNNNHFGMKCFSKNCKKGHCSNYTDDTHKDFFLKFSKAELSWDAHSKLLASGRYAKLKKYGRDYRRWAQGLKNAGYATDKTYDQKLIGIIQRYELNQYDN